MNTGNTEPTNTEPTDPKMHPALIAGGLNLAPGGPLFSERYGQWFAGPETKAREKFLSELSANLIDLEGRVADLEVAIKDLPERPIFREAVRRAIETAMVTDDEEVLSAFRRATINIAEHPTADQDLRRRFLGYLPDLTWQHIDVLRVANNPRSVASVRPVPTDAEHAMRVMAELLPWTGNRAAELKQVLREIYAMGLVTHAEPLGFTKRLGRLPDMGRKFCEFIGI